jgi:hypothetical protein
MTWARKSLGGILWVILLLSLLGLALSTSANITFSHPKKIESWLNQSNLYGHFVSNTISQAEKAAGSADTLTSVTLGGTAVQDAANSTFTTSLFQKDVNTFLDSNYSWLNGKTSKPNFTINLLSIKQSFANQVATYVEAHINSLPVCTTQQLLQISSTNNIDPLNATCRPSTLSAQAEANSVSAEIVNSKDFLSNPILTADNIKNSGNNHQPYYKKFSSAPKLYKATVEYPWIYLVIDILSALSVIFIAVNKRRGLRKVCVALILSGVILIAIGFIDNLIVKNLDNKLFNRVGDSQVQLALKNFLKLAVHHSAQIVIWFGVAYLIIAAIKITFLLITSRKENTKPKVQEPPIETKESSGIAPRFRSNPQNSAPPPPRIPAPTGPPPPPPQRKKPPRLVQ